MAGTLIGGTYAIVKSIKQANFYLLAFSIVAFFLPPAGILSGIISLIIQKKEKTNSDLH
jgi:hypothetical protein